MLTGISKQERTPPVSFAAPIARRIADARSDKDRSFRYTVVGIEAVREVLAVLIRGVFHKHLAVRGALEGLEAGLALDRLGSRILV